MMQILPYKKLTESMVGALGQDEFTDFVLFNFGGGSYSITDNDLAMVARSTA